MKALRPLPTIEILCARFHLCDRTGVLTWKPCETRSKGWNARFAGKQAGSLNCRGYRTVVVDGVSYLEHRVIFKMVNGYDPVEVDHRQGFCNAPANLRNATRTQNLANRGAAKRKLLPKGVVETPRGRFHAQITISRKTVYIGAFGNPEDAHAAYAAKSRSVYGEFSRAK